MKLDRILATTVPVPFAEVRRVLLVDDHAPTRTAIKALLDSQCPCIQVVAAAGDGATALRLISQAKPNIVVLDVHLGDEYGLDLLPALARRPELAVIVLTASCDPQDRRSAFAAGAVAFISKYSPAEELIAAILATCPRRIGGLSCRTGTVLPRKQVECSDTDGIVMD